MTAEEALLELGREAGSRFDPSLVELFTGMVREIDSPKEMCQGG
jgi:response regulator RpfG family c-di-GMP phosphodiesterase